MAELVPLQNLVAAVKAAADGGKSGAFFITTDEQHSAMITMSGGRITGAKFRNARGYDAAAALARCPQVKYRTAAEPTELPGESALNTVAVLEILTTGESEPAAGGSGTAAVDLDTIRERYISAIGPVGGALFDEAVDELGDRLSTRDGVRELIDKLAAQIDDDQEAKSFRGDVGA